MKYLQIFIQTTLLIVLTSTGNAEITCVDKVRQLDLKREDIVFNGGMWGYFEKNYDLEKSPLESLQLDSRINKIFFLLNHLCETQNGIPLTPLAKYVSQNLTEKGEKKFKDELLLLGKTIQQIDEWFKFSRYAENQISRTLVISEIQKAIDNCTPLIKRYVQLTEIISHGSLQKNKSFQKMLTLIADIDRLLSNQPYLAQASEETSQILYWDITEGDLG